MRFYESMGSLIKNKISGSWLFEFNVSKKESTTRCLGTSASILESLAVHSCTYLYIPYSVLCIMYNICVYIYTYYSSYILIIHIHIYIYIYILV